MFTKNIYYICNISLSIIEKKLHKVFLHSKLVSVNNKFTKNTVIVTQFHLDYCALDTATSW